ncbi:hypothetical protein ACF0H5_018206 [Mactra antiquata]
MEGNTSMNETEEFQATTLSTSLTISFRVGGCFIILLNSLTFLTVSLKKNNSMQVYSLQIICLSANDILAGVATVLLSLVEIPVLGGSFVKCASILMFAILTQSASLFNIFGIAVYRFIALKNLKIRNSWNDKFTIGTSVLSWIVSSSLCAIPVYLYSDSDGFAERRHCSLYSLYGHNAQSAIFISFIGSFLIPLIFTNVIYVTLYCTMLKVKTHPSSSSNTAGNSNILHMNVIPQGDNSTKRETQQASLVSTLTKQYENQHPSTSRLHVPGVRRINVLPMTSPSLNAITSNRSSNILLSPESLTTQRIKRAFTLIGFVLFCLNACSLPCVAVVIIRYIQFNGHVNRNVLASLFGLVCLNSLINPLLYAAVIPDFRAPIIEALRNLRRTIIR